MIRTNSNRAIDCRWRIDRIRRAESLYDIPNDITAGSTTYSNAWVCGPDTSGDYQAQLGGGCQVVGTGENVDVRDWSGINSCSMVATDANGIQSNTCSGSTSIEGVPTNVSCTNKWAVVNASFVVQSGGNFNWTEMNASQISSAGGTTLCSAMPGGTEKNNIAKLQCYAEYYERSGMGHSDSVCLPSVEMDWTATTAANFINVDLIRPEGLVFFERFNPFPDGSGGAMNTREEHFEGVQVGNSWVNCRVIESGGFSIKKISDTKMLATYTSSTITTSTSKPACLGRFNGSRETFMFYLNK